MNRKKRQRFPLNILKMKKCSIVIAFFTVILSLSGCKAPYPFMDKGELYYPPYEKLTPQQMIQRQYVLDHKNLDSRTKNAILSGSIFQGMTTDEVIASWGEPDNKSTAKTPQGHIAQWIYNTGDYLYFLNGILYENKKQLTY